MQQKQDDSNRVLTQRSDIPQIGRVYTTGAVAKILKVAPRTVGKWFDSGQLKGFRIPGSKDRRIPHEDLVRFVREHGFPESLMGFNSVILYGCPALVCDHLAASYLPAHHWTVQQTDNLFDLGVRLSQVTDFVLILDQSIGEQQLSAVIQYATKRTNGKVLLLLNEDDNMGQTYWKNRGFHGTIKHPVHPEKLLNLVSASL